MEMRKEGRRPGHIYLHSSWRAGLCAGLTTSCDLSLDALLFTQFVCKITKRESEEEVWSSVNYLFFIPTSLIYRKQQHVRQGIV